MAPMPIDAPTALRNVLQLLQQEPRRYKLFGVWWPAVKVMLKRAGYGPDQLYMLGEYQLPNIAALAPPAGLEDTLVAALEEYGQNARFPHPDGLVEDPDGELVAIYDEDAGF
jgi:hypothetical protein